MKLFARSDKGERKDFDKSEKAEQHISDSLSQKPNEKWELGQEPGISGEAGTETVWAEYSAEDFG